MFRNQDLNSILGSLQTQYDRYFKQKTESLRNFLLVSPTQYQDVFRYFDLTRLNLKISKKKQMIGLAIVSWYFPKEIRFLVHEELRERWDPESKEVMEILLNSHDFAVTWLIMDSKWTESDFFGNVLNKDLSRIFSLTEFQRVSRKSVKKYTGYCRGYKDSNHGAPSLPMELRPTESTVEAEELKELRYQERLQTLHFLVEEQLQYLIQETLAAQMFIQEVVLVPKFII